MAGSVRRLTILVVISSLPEYSVLQQPESFIQNPFRFKTNFLKDFMKRREEIFPFTFQRPPGNFYIPRPSSSLGQQRLTPKLIPLEAKESNLVKRRVRRPTLDVGHNQNHLILRKRVTDVKRNGIQLNNIPLQQNNERLKIPNVTHGGIPDPHKGVFDIKIKELYKLLESNDSAQIPGNLSQVDQLKEGEDKDSKTSFLGYVISTLTQLPIIGNVFRASVDPLFRPIVNKLQPDNETLMRGESDMKNWCFGELGCIEPTSDFFHPLFRPVNLPPDSRKKIGTTFSVFSHEEKKGYSFSAMKKEDLLKSSFDSSRPTKIIVHGYLNDRHETWIMEMIRGFLAHGNYNVIAVDWAGGSHALYSQATANVRVVALELSMLLEWAERELQLKFSDVHIIGYSLGAHMAGYVGERVRGIGRITGLDPAEPFFQYMPKSVRLDHSDAAFVDVIHTDTNSFFALTGASGFGLQQAVGHVDFYPNGGKDQPGCNELLARVPMTLMIEGQDFTEGINAAQDELINCNHVRSTKLFTDSLYSRCPYLGFSCQSYKIYKEGKCFSCGAHGENCSFMGIDADTLKPNNKKNVKMFLDTHVAPNYCKYHYILTINFVDPSTSTGSLRGRMKISLIDEEGSLKKFDLTPLAPIKFPRRGSKMFLLEHYEDLSNSQEALLSWTFESDLLDPLTFCVLFCKADLTISSVSILSVDNPQAASNVIKMRAGLIEGKKFEIMNGGEIVMCHKKGYPYFTIGNEDTIKISASPACRSIRENSEKLLSNNTLRTATKLARFSSTFYQGG